MPTGSQRTPARSRALIFVDEGNLTGISSKLSRPIDWLRLREMLSKDKDVLEMVVYAGLPPTLPEWQEFRQKRERFLHWLEVEGFLVVRKQGRPTTQQSYKANVDVMMAVEITEMCLEIQPDVITLVTGDGDFGFLACKLRRRGIRVEVAAFENNLGDDLKIAANTLVDLSTILKPGEMKGSEDRSEGVVARHLQNS